MLRICTYNIEHFDKRFNSDNTLKLRGKSKEALTSLKEIVATIDPDILGIVEAPNTSLSSDKSTVECLENFAQWAGLRQSKALIGYPSAGQQELALLYDPDKVTLQHSPGGRRSSKSNPRFNEELYFDTDNDNIKEVYKFYRPPLEAKVSYGEGQELYILLAHAKSKGIFKATDMIHWQRESERNRRKLFAECSWIRKRVDEWQKQARKIVVMGDMNDGPGMDFYEYQFGRSAVEIIMGDLFHPATVLNNHIGRPKWTNKGWSPYSARFKDRFTGANVNVLIDHILSSQNLDVSGDQPLILWNPYEEALAKPLKRQLTRASDHFPISLDIRTD
ncbi:MAG TPA: hypothetical protein ENK35_02755 [Candidatus Tenderia sp.]|nr:hypothetical protein [Candidatus Tenderia sp.]